MPNHCTTVLTLKGDFKHRQEFVDKNKGFEWGDTMKAGAYKELSFHAQVPMPQKHIASHAKNRSMLPMPRIAQTAIGMVGLTRIGEPNGIATKNN
jgi:hypothetical protein